MLSARHAFAPFRTPALPVGVSQVLLFRAPQVIARLVRGRILPRRLFHLLSLLSRDREASSFEPPAS
jgi:hypothetical protein